MIDTWHIRPRYVADSGLDNVWSGWIVPAPEVLEARERALVPEGYSRSSDPERTLQSFLARSHWFNDLVEAQATELGMNVLRQPGDATVDDLCEQVVEALGSRTPRPVTPAP